MILEFYKYYNRGLRKAISVILDDQQNKPIRTFLVRFVLDLLDWNSKGFYFFMGDMDEEVAYHDAQPRPNIIGRNNKKTRAAFQEPK